MTSRANPEYVGSLTDGGEWKFTNVRWPTCQGLADEIRFYDRTSGFRRALIESTNSGSRKYGDRVKPHSRQHRWKIDGVTVSVWISIRDRSAREYLAGMRRKKKIRIYTYGAPREYRKRNMTGLLSANPRHYVQEEAESLRNLCV